MTASLSLNGQAVSIFRPSSDPGATTFVVVAEFHSPHRRRTCPRRRHCGRSRQELFYTRHWGGCPGIRNKVARPRRERQLSSKIRCRTREGRTPSNSFRGNTATGWRGSEGHATESEGSVHCNCPSWNTRCDETLFKIQKGWRFSRNLTTAFPGRVWENPASYIYVAIPWDHAHYVFDVTWIFENLCVPVKAMRPLEMCSIPFASQRLLQYSENTIYMAENYMIWLIANVFNGLVYHRDQIHWHHWLFFDMVI